jgi:hypothetical protein
MKILRFLLFFFTVWFFAVVPLLGHHFFWSTDQWVISSLVVSVVNAICVVILLLIFRLLKKKWKILLSPGIALSVLYGMIAFSLFIWGWTDTSEPLIWEAILPLISILCPLSSYAVVFTAFLTDLFIVDVLVRIGFGALYYFLLGDLVFQRLLPTKY